MSERETMRFKAAIRAVALEDGIPAQVVLQNFMLERLLARIVKTPVRDNLVVKGGFLISNLLGLSKRTTMDFDATVRNAPLTEASLVRMLKRVFEQDIGDGIAFAITSVAPIRDNDTYGGFRVKFTATRGLVVVALSADFSAGDVITPGPSEYYLKSRFVDNMTFKVWGYTIETMLAEKIQTILSRGVLNTRPRDFYDVAALVEVCSPDVKVLSAALKATCEHRNTPDVLRDPMALLADIRSDEGMIALWEKYRKQYSFAVALSFDAVCGVVADLVQKAFR